MGKENNCDIRWVTIHALFCMKQIVERDDTNKIKKLKDRKLINIVNWINHIEGCNSKQSVLVSCEVSRGYRRENNGFKYCVIS